MSPVRPALLSKRVRRRIAMLDSSSGTLCGDECLWKVQQRRSRGGHSKEIFKALCSVMPDAGPRSRQSHEICLASCRSKCACADQGLVHIFASLANKRVAERKRGHQTQKPLKQNMESKRTTRRRWARRRTWRQRCPVAGPLPPAPACRRASGRRDALRKICCCTYVLADVISPFQRNSARLLAA